MLTFSVNLHLFTTVVILEQVMRQAGNNLNTIAFRKLLMNLRDGKVTEDEWTTLLQRSPTTANNMSDFESAVHLFNSNLKVSHYNMSARNITGSKPQAWSDGVADAAAPE